MAGTAPCGLLASSGLDVSEAMVSPNGRARWNTTLGYEQLLSIQQHQHTLAMQHKEAEVAHIKACMDLLESDRTFEDKDKLTEALRSKDEEAALMMAAKHKELELMASLLQLREQQIEDLRQLCETQQAEITQLKRRHAGVPRHHAHSASAGGASVEVGAAAAGRGGGAAVGRRDDTLASSPSTVAPARRSAGGAQEDHTLQLEREVRRMRLKMEEMESAIAEQHQRSAGLAEALEQKSNRVKALERQMRTLQLSPSGAWPDSGEGTLEALGTEQQHSRHRRPNHAPGNAGDLAETVVANAGYRAADDGDQERAGQQEFAPRSRSDHPPHGGLRRIGLAQSLPRLPLPPQQAPQGRWDGGAAEASGGYPQYSGVVEQRPATGLLGGPQTLPPQLRPQGSAFPGAGGSGTYPGTGGSRSFPRVGGGGVYASSGALSSGCCLDNGGDAWKHSAPEAAETGRQSEELLREMRRLRLQMSELERVAGSRCGSGGREQGPPGRSDALGVSSSSLGVSSAAGGAQVVAEALHPREPIAAVGAPPGPRGPAWQWPRPCASQPALALLVSGNGPGGADSGCGGNASSLAPAATDFGGWEYRPHASGDPVDAAVAALVNQPNGRYRSWRALLCRLEHGVYLCGTRRVHLRADATAGAIEASADGGSTWSDLVDLMRGSEASQHALLERARGAIGSAVSGDAAPSRANAWGSGLGA